MNKLRRVLIICAHSDDQVIGVGGTIALLAKQKVEVQTIICSFGELTHPHLKPVTVRRMRVLESKKADRILGGDGITFLNLREGKFLEDYEQWHDKIVRKITEFSPDRIFTHSSDDPHPDHRAVHKILMRVVEEAKLPCEVYTFDIWNLFNIKKRRNARLIVDISQTFAKKLDALATFRSQKLAMFTLGWSVYTKAIYYGLKRHCRYAEVFYRVR